ncbi:MAG: tRNA1(Val) (adenine(37)-N6)-methyltransferase [Bacillaceae bacterium]|nr:tRNA1(Val) (adenine(37)-N6)-methyltransferase [Bacillaceae bacterium]
MERVPLYPSERIDDLLTQDLKIIQSREVFSFSMDAVLLARFVTLPKKGKVMDLCTGNGVIPLLMSTRTEAHIDGVEIQERLYDMARRSVMMNQKRDQIAIHHGDAREADHQFGNGKYDVLTCNPPYLPKVGGEKNENPHIAIARHEILITLEDIVRVSCRLVRSGGKVAFVYRPSRLAELMALMKQYRIEPKRMRLVHPKKGEEANIVLLEGIRDGKPDLKVLPPLIVYQDDGEYCEEIYNIYYGKSDSLV